MVSLIAPTVELFIHGRPRPQPRMRGTYRGGFVRMYTPSSADVWKRQIREAVGELEETGGFLLNGPLAVDLQFQFARPKRLQRKKDTDERIPHIIKPDIDNLEKCVLDVFTKEKMWHDDSQVFVLSSSKHYVSRSGDHMLEGCSVKIFCLE